jgi:DUF438 domain-containing protein
MREVTRMDSRILFLIFDSWNKPIVFVDTDHIIRYMNKPAKRNYSKWGDVVGRSLLDCHNERSRAIIRKSLRKLADGEREVEISSSTRHRVYMRGVKDEKGELIGYYERYDPPVKKDDEQAV